MKRLVVALVLVLMTSGAALAGRLGFGISFGFPLFYPYYSYPYYSYPYYGYPSSYGYPAYSYPESYTVYEEPQAHQGRKPGKVIENYYVNGRLVERRVKIYDNQQGKESDGDYER